MKKQRMKHTEIRLLRNATAQRRQSERDGERKKNSAQNAHANEKPCQEKWKISCNYSMSVILMPFFPEFWDWQNNNTCQSSSLRYNLFFLSLFLFISQFCIYHPVLVDAVQYFDSTLPFFVHIQLIIQRWAHTKNLHWVCSLFLVIVFIFNGLRLHKQQHEWIECQPYNGLKVKLDRWAWSL